MVIDLTRSGIYVVVRPLFSTQVIGAEAKRPGSKSIEVLGLLI
jgi:hypothetical protein